VNIRDGIWFMDMTGVIEKEKVYCLYSDKDGGLHLKSTDGNTYRTSSSFWDEIQEDISILDEKQSAEAAWSLVKMLKCKLYVELSMMEDSGMLTPSERVLINTLFNDDDIRNITGR